MKHEDALTYAHASAAENGLTMLSSLGYCFIVVPSFRSWSTVELLSRFPAKILSPFLCASCLLIASGFGVGQQAAIAETWKASECESDVDSGGDPIQVCDDGYNLGVFWNDGSFVNGSCQGSGYDIKYKGMSKSDAIAWVKEFCN